MMEGFDKDWLTADNATRKVSWYPGNSTVDILSIDSYPGNFVYTTDQSEFDKVYSISGGKKMIAMSENGPIPDV